MKIPFRTALAVLLSGLLLPPLAAKDAPPGPLRVLFVGNSYIYVNGLPEVVAAIAARRGVDMQTGMLALPNFAIEDHFSSGDYEQMIGAGWDWVILQQGPSSQPASRAHLRFWTGRAAEEARPFGVRVSLMGAWPALPNAHTWLDAELSYRLAATDTGACVFPVAGAWRLSQIANPTINLYDQDQLHASRAGTLLAALVIVRGLLPGPYRPDPPELTGLLGPEWTQSLRHLPALDRVAIAGDQQESARCKLDK